jgi:hypothetical protein
MNTQPRNRKSEPSPNRLMEVVKALGAVLGVALTLFGIISGISGQPLIALVVALVVAILVSVWVVYTGWTGLLEVVVAWLVLIVIVLAGFVVWPRTMTVEGTVCDTAGTLISHESVALVDLYGVRRETFTDAEGRYQFKGVPSGPYRVIAGEEEVGGEVTGILVRVLRTNLTIPEPTVMPIPTNTPIPTHTPILPTPSPTLTPSPALTPTPSPTLTPSPVLTPSPSSTLTSSPSPTLTSSPSPTFTPSPSPIPSGVIVQTDSTLGWGTYGDDKGSTLMLRTKTIDDNTALEIAYDLKEWGWVGISQDIDPAVLVGTKGLRFSYGGSGAPNTIELKLLYMPDDNGNRAVFSVLWHGATATDGWRTLEATYGRLRCWEGTGCTPGSEIDIAKVGTIDLAISNKLDQGDKRGEGVIMIDDIRAIR